MDFFFISGSKWQCALHACKEGRLSWLVVHVCTVLAEGRKPLCCLRLLTP